VTSCKECGAQFAPTRRDARFCSGRCRVAAHRAKTHVLRSTAWVIARDLDEEPPRTIYWWGFDTCGNLRWIQLTQNPASWPTRAEAEAAWRSACGAAPWVPPATRAVQLTADQVALLTPFRQLTVKRGFAQEETP
jgi:hypothetical protein